MTKPAILVATWGDGLFAVTGDGRTQEIANQPVRGLAPDGGGGALAIVGRHSLRRRAPGGAWTTVATSDFEFRAVWLFERPSTLERTMHACCG